MQLTKLILCLSLFAIQTCQAEQPKIILFGDSITSAMGNRPFGKCATLNLAEGGTGVSKNLEAAQKTKENADAVLIAVGINDAREANPPYKSIKAWEADLDKLVQEGLRIGKATYIATILPTEKGRQPYGDYASASKISRMNTRIKAVAKHRHAIVLDSHQQFAAKMANFTKDGVHPNDESSLQISEFWTQNRACPNFCVNGISFNS